MRQIVRFFRTTVTKVDGNRCPMYPTCSHYGEQALSKHGAIVGTWMFIDRLFHEWSEMSVAPKVQVHGVERYWDPLEENDFWLNKDKVETGRSPHSLDGGGHDSTEPRVSTK